jgi:SH3-like domain-containing protein
MRKIKKSFLVASIFLLGLPFEAWSQAPPAGTGLPLPRFVSIRSEEVNMRTGPGVRYPVDWVYHRKSMPVEVVN